MGHQPHPAELLIEFVLMVIVMTMLMAVLVGTVAGCFIVFDEERRKNKNLLYVWTCLMFLFGGVLGVVIVGLLVFGAAWWRRYEEQKRREEEERQRRIEILAQMQEDEERLRQERLRLAEEYQRYLEWVESLPWVIEVVEEVVVVEQRRG